jgi:hypothetical protein
VGVQAAPGIGPDAGFDASATGVPTRVYATLLALYPAAFRARYRDEMVLLFGDQLRAARASRGSAGIVATWARGIVDLTVNALGEHVRGDRTVAQSLATFEPTRGMRFLGLFGVVGAGLLLWAFISFNPFQDQVVNTVRLLVFSLAGAAITLGFYRRQALVAPTLAALTTAGVVIAGVWYATWILLSGTVDRPFLGTFGFLNMLANIALWVTPAIWAIGMLHVGAAWQGMPRRLAAVTRLGVWTLLGSIVAWFGDDRLGMVDSLWGDFWQAVALAGVLMNGLGWLLLGGVLLLGGRASGRASA